jgi:predicted CopG family antitoxin
VERDKPQFCSVDTAPGATDIGYCRDAGAAAQPLSRIDPNVEATMDTPNEQIRVSDTVKRELDRRRREGESFNDVLDRILLDDRDLLAGFGSFEGTDRGEVMREIHEQGMEESRDRTAETGERRSNQ